MRQVLAISRNERFSPNSVEKDRAILMAVCERLKEAGHQVTVVGEADARMAGRSYDTVLTMGREPQTLNALRQAEGVRVINGADGVARCAREVLQQIMKQTHTPMPPAEGRCGYWLKRGDAAAQQRGDVVFAPDQESLEHEIARFHERGIRSYVVSAHVEGDVVKFYGVRGTPFFRYYYPTDDGDTKFGDEKHNGKARHYAFQAGQLHQIATRLAEAVGIEVYGGDCIVRSDGSLCIIDFNDWPSFSRCREEAAEAIASLVDNE